MPWSAVREQSGSIETTSDGFRATTPGVYDIVAQVVARSTTASGTIAMQILRDRSVAVTRNDSIATGWGYYTITSPILLRPGQTITVGIRLTGVSAQIDVGAATTYLRAVRYPARV